MIDLVVIFEIIPYAHLMIPDIETCDYRLPSS